MIRTVLQQDRDPTPAWGPLTTTCITPIGLLWSVRIVRLLHHNRMHFQTTFPDMSICRTTLHFFFLDTDVRNTYHHQVSIASDEDSLTFDLFFVCEVSLDSSNSERSSSGKGTLQY